MNNQDCPKKKNLLEILKYVDYSTVDFCLYLNEEGKVKSTESEKKERSNETDHEGHHITYVHHLRQ